jgi:hypothetical protein
MKYFPSQAKGTGLPIFSSTAPVRHPGSNSRDTRSRPGRQALTSRRAPDLKSGRARISSGVSNRSAHGLPQSVSRIAECESIGVSCDKRVSADGAERREGLNVAFDIRVLFEFPTAGRKPGRVENLHERHVFAERNRLALTAGREVSAQRWGHKLPRDPHWQKSTSSLFNLDNQTCGTIGDEHGVWLCISSHGGHAE